MDTCDEYVRELRRINFARLLKVKYSPIEEYSISVFEKNNRRHFVTDFCQSCEARGCSIGKAEYSRFTLQNISHGTLARDYFDAMGVTEPSDKGWSDTPVMFLFENPSDDPKDHETVTAPNGLTKRPAKNWYWLPEQIGTYSYPKYFQGRKYGELILSIMHTFRLRNVYITNLVKCGLSDSNGSGRVNLSGYTATTIDNCIKEVFLLEIHIFNPKLMFSFGARVKELVEKKQLSQSRVHVNLPHPARAQSGFSDDLFRKAYFWGVVEGLYRAGIRTSEEIHEECDLFLECSSKLATAPDQV